MSRLNCAREREVAEILRQGFWPDACLPELCAHVSACRACSDLVVVAGAFQAARRGAIPSARLESAGALWWRAQIRRRNAAIETVTRPILGAQIFALIMSLVVAVAVLVLQGTTLKAWIVDLPRALHLDALMPELSQSGNAMWTLLPVLATVALLGGVVVYLSAEKQ